MAGDSKKLQPIIVKKIKKGGHGHHGGAWKIAYADFVTAMMAFFLLMWLLGSVTEGDKKGIADYFNSPLKVALLQSGSGSGDSSHVIKGGGQDLSRQGGQVKNGDVEAQRKTINLAALKVQKFDFVVCDINMPNMNGFELLKAMRADDALKHIPLLMVTAEARKEDIVLAAQTGASGYIVKPFTKATLEEKVQKIVQKLAA